MEHIYWARENDANRAILSFPPLVAPTKCLLVPLSNNEEFVPFTTSLSHQIRRLGISNRVDASGATIGKRYARNDELGTPFGITIDFQTVKDKTVTLRERDTTKQVRGSMEEVVSALGDMVNGRKSWQDVMKELPIFESQEKED